MKLIFVTIVFLLIGCQEVVNRKAPPDDDNSTSYEESCEDCDKAFVESDESICNNSTDMIWLAGQCEYVVNHNSQIPEIEYNVNLTYDEEIRLKKSYLLFLLDSLNGKYGRKELEKIVIESGGENILEGKILKVGRESVSVNEFSKLLRK